MQQPAKIYNIRNAILTKARHSNSQLMKRNNVIKEETNQPRSLKQDLNILADNLVSSLQVVAPSAADQHQHQHHQSGMQ